MTCRFPCCPRQAHARGLCKAHYNACLRNGNLARYEAPQVPRRRGQFARTLDLVELTPPPEDPQYVAEILGRIATAKAEREAAK